MKKLFALALAVMMIFSLAAVAFAAETPTYSITITNNPTSTGLTLVGSTFKAYKLFDVTYSTHGSVTSYAYTISDTDPLFAAVSAYTDYFTITKNITGTYNVEVKPAFTAEAARTLADALQPSLPATATATATADSESVVLNVGTHGYYLVYAEGTPTDNGGDNNKTVVAALALQNAAPTAAVAIKASAPTLDKKIGTTPAKVDKTEVSVNVGDTVYFELTATIPDTTGYSKYTYYIQDTMSSGLTPPVATDVVVTYNGGDFPEGTGYEVDISGQTLKVTLSNVLGMTKGATVLVKYPAVLNEDALETDVEKNTAKVVYSNNPYDDSTEETPEKKTKVYDFDIVVDKFISEGGEDTGIKLNGAKFVLYKEVNDAPAYYCWDETEKAVTWVSDIDDATVVMTDGTNTDGSEKGYGVFQGVAEGGYYLKETEAPEGFNILLDDVQVAVNKDSAAKSPVQLTITKSVGNAKGDLLPSTGGMGTTLFYVIGSVMVLAAGVLLVTKRRMKDFNV